MKTFYGSTKAFAHARFLGAILFPLCAALSCSSSVAPERGPTLLVTNGTCSSGQCDSLVVLGFPSNQPTTPGGMWSLNLGLMTASQACFTIPPSATFNVIGVHEDGTPDTTTYVWTNAKSFSLGAHPPSLPRLLAGPSTAEFVPEDAAGWRVTIPTGATATPSSVCTP